MANPVGTTARQLAALARWALAVLVIVSMFAWWWPSLRAWGSLMAGLGVVLLLWTMWRTVARDRSIPGHPFHVALLGPILILVGHLFREVTGQVSGNSHLLAGGLLGSLILLFSLIALGVLLAQSLLVRISDAPRFHAILALAMMIGADTALTVPGSEPVRPAMTLLGFAGVLVWLAPLWPFRSPDTPEESDADEPPDRAGMVEAPWLTRLSWVGWLGVAVTQLLVLTLVRPTALLVAMVLTGPVFLLAGIFLRARRVRFLVVGLALAAAGTGGLAVWAPDLLQASPVDAGPLGLGEQALKQLTVTDSGWRVLGSFVGWVGLLWLLGGALVCVVLMLLAVRREPTDRQAGAVIWTAATVAGTAALFARGGLVIPAVAMAVSLLWGALPSIADRRRPARSGWWVFAWMAGLLLMFGLTANNGLLGWTMQQWGLSDKTAHFVLAIAVTAMLAWLMGSRRVRWGLAGIVLAASLGVVGEGLQMLFSHRGVEKADAVAHALGSAVVLVPYLLCMGSRWSESRDVRPSSARDAYASTYR
jgi:hypothetical protein